MSPFAAAVQIGLSWGLVLSLLMAGLFLGGALLSPDAMLRGYPPDIKARYGAVSPRGRRIQRLMGIALVVILGGTMAGAMAALADAGGLAFFPAAVCAFAMLAMFNLVDLLVLDWLLFVAIQPRFVVLPGTEGLAGYGDYGFHFRGFLRGLILAIIMSPMIAGSALAVRAIAA